MYFSQQQMRTILFHQYFAICGLPPAVWTHLYVQQTPLHNITYIYITRVLKVQETMLEPLQINLEHLITQFF